MTRNLTLVLGDQLDRRSAVFDGFDACQDRLWMAEVAEEAGYLRQHQQRLVLFFSAMRHFRDALRGEGVSTHYHALCADPADDRGASFAALLREDVPRLKPRRLLVLEPGDWRVCRDLLAVADELDVRLEIRADRHFYCDTEDFRRWAHGRKTLVLEHFYREMRRRHDVLMEDGDPVGGAWNFDKANRESFGRDGPGETPPLPVFAPDDITREVMAMVARRFADHPGCVEGFEQPVTPQAAREALDAFIDRRLCRFGELQDAMWTGAPFLYHSRLSSVLNLHLLDPRVCVDAAVEAWRAGRAPINAVEGFVRQILGWREFVRGVYWLHMPGYAQHNALGHDEPVPAVLWHGETEMRCLREAVANVLANGYAHHIQRLMVLGLFCQLYGVHPYRFHEWHMVMYLDAIDWVSLPNTLGMSQFGDGGVIGTKPYAASGAYIARMSNYCRHCRYDPKRADGDDACPITTLYWDFLDRHQKRLAGNRRLQFQMKNLVRKQADAKLMDAIRSRAEWLKSAFRNGEPV